MQSAKPRQLTSKHVRTIKYTSIPQTVLTRHLRPRYIGIRIRMRGMLAIVHHNISLPSISVAPSPHSLIYKTVQTRHLCPDHDDSVIFMPSKLGSALTHLTKACRAAYGTGWQLFTTISIPTCTPLRTRRRNAGFILLITSAGPTTQLSMSLAKTKGSMSRLCEDG